MRRVVIESPLAGDFGRNKRYALWCALDCRRRGESAYASHLFFPQFLDDKSAEDREFGITAGYAWAELADVYAFYIDLGMSGGMVRAEKRWPEERREYRKLPADLMANFAAGWSPKTTPGFDVVTAP